MNIAPIKYDNSRRYKSANPSFQNLKIISPEHWDKDILDFVNISLGKETFYFRINYLKSWSEVPIIRRYYFGVYIR